MTQAQFGMIGLGTMGRNFLLNVVEHGFSGIGYNKHHDNLELLLEEGKGMPVTGVDNVPDFYCRSRGAASDHDARTRG